MSDKFEKDVDKFDAGESMDMHSDGEIIKEISVVSEVLGERELRIELKRMNDRYVNKQRSVYWMIGAAASILLVAVFYMTQLSGENVGTPTPLHMDEQPQLLDSASYVQDSVRIHSEIDSLKD